jgi:magnesium chelatase family protein
MAHRAKRTLTFPASFTLLAARNPCLCGYYGGPALWAGGRECSFSNNMITRYQNRISGPLMDRIDLHVEVPRVAHEKLSSDRLGEPSANIRERVESARLVQ